MQRIPPLSKESAYYVPSDFRRVIGELGFVVSFPRGQSMRPLIWEGQHYVIVSRLDNLPVVGDILAFEYIRREKTDYIVHRVVNIENVDGVIVYVMRGDNSIGNERIRQEDIIGRVTEVYRKGCWKPWHANPRKHFTVEDKSYIFYSWLWMKSWSFRKRLFLFRSYLSKVKHRLI